MSASGRFEPATSRSSSGGDTVVRSGCVWVWQPIVADDLLHREH
jgi:hypothetical protein